MSLNAFILMILLPFTLKAFSLQAEEKSPKYLAKTPISRPAEEEISNPKGELFPETETAGYLLDDPVMKFTLERLFNDSSATLTPEYIQSLGFTFLNQMGLHVLVAKHPGMHGYVFKFFQYNVFPGIDWRYWIQRVEGAKLIKEGIRQFGYEKLFKVPRKWLFKTPCLQVIEGRTYPSFILIAEDMRLVPFEENQKLWRKKTTEATLIALHKMIKTYGLRDCARITNVPWCKDGKIAFVDTETFHSTSLNYHPLVEFLSRKNKIRWEHIVHAGGDPMSPP
ncbi:hypothetical protein [Estrella lausannensis]|uniref:Putative secreted protein n=1 Tax=Estrella lausannensis TaxID=483423 RepID=A0A0H5DS43_9BACT|nr:hypothetical protein [Estrella lausannensis]CRX39078.1 putative secreted protein [Estrella lausannensis]